VPWFLNFLVLSVAHRGGKEISALDNTFALIDEYICADLSLVLTLCPLQLRGGPYIREVSPYTGGFQSLPILNVLYRPFSDEAPKTNRERRNEPTKLN
jgi:hypothetical protein